MSFEGPISNDFLNVGALNRAFLHLLQSDSRARESLRRLPRPIAGDLESLTPLKVDRLSAAPFLLMSFRERDDDLWRQVFAPRPASDLFAGAVSGEYDRLRSAGLGFIWQLARQNPFTLRLVCGASLHWCEEIADRTVFALLAGTAPFPDLLRLRRAGDAELWRMLLDRGTSRQPTIRAAAHVSALQTILTCPPSQPAGSWRVAARRTGLRVAERRDHRAD